jgi:hypothetical protein
MGGQASGRWTAAATEPASIYPPTEAGGILFNSRYSARYRVNTSTFGDVKPGFALSAVNSTGPPLPVAAGDKAAFAALCDNHVAAPAAAY